MKKNFRYIGFAFLASLGVMSCSETDFEDNYYDPEKSVTASVEKLYTGLLYNNNLENRNTTFPRYWNLFTFQIPMLGTYSQTNGYTNGQKIYEQATAYNQDRWDYYYTAFISNYREMENHYNSIEDAEQKEQFRLFMETGKVHLYDQTSQMVDIWGDIPFSEAGGLITTGGDIIRPKYDKAEDIYMTMIDDLKNIADFLNSYEPIAFYKAAFDNADILNQGDIEKWKIYANSLRLRLAMRISYYDEAKAQAVVGEILNNPGTYPVVSNVDETVQFVARGEQLNYVLTHHGGGIKDATIGRTAPGYMVNDLMVPSMDPRLRVMFSENKNGDYVGVPNDWAGSRVTDSTQANYFSRLDTATYSRNDKFPGIIITAAEVSLFKAEAAERWSIGGDAAENYEAGIRQSIAFLYHINNLNDNADGTNFVPEEAPTEEEIAAFLSSDIISYTGSMDEKLAKIGTQQWLNHGLMYAYHAWAEYRRTGYPALEFVEDPSSTQSTLPPLRLFYPETERTLNTENYNEVAAEDKVDVPIFWDVN